jgi:hypothetical protein
MAWAVPAHSKGRVGADPARQLHDGLGCSLASGLDDVGGAELLGDHLAVRMAAQGDDATGTQPAGGQDGGQPDCPVADDRHDTAAPHTSADGRMVTGRHDVGEREQRSQRLIRMAGARNPHQGASRQRNPHGLTLTTVDRAVAEVAALHAGDRRSPLAVRA